MSEHKYAPFEDECGYRGISCSCGYTASTGDLLRDCDHIAEHIGQEGRERLTRQLTRTANELINANARIRTKDGEIAELRKNLKKIAGQAEEGS